MAVEVQTIKTPPVENAAQEFPPSSSWQEITSYTVAKGSEKLNQLSVHITKRTWDFFAETAYNSIMTIPAIVKTASIHGVLTAGALIAETTYAPSEHQFQWYAVTLGIAGVSLGLSILEKILQENYD
jgi:hypothetical protein